MNIRTVVQILGRLSVVYAVVLCVPLIVSLLYEAEHPGKREPLAFLVAIGVSLTIGLLLKFFVKGDLSKFGHREGFAIVTFGWITLAILGAIPYMLVGGLAPDGSTLALSPLDAFFETMSGLTTTGATVFTSIESYGHGILFWRSMTQWIGGMGMIMLTVAILPSLGAGGYQLMRAEVPGPTADKIAPRIAQTGRILWVIYVSLTLAIVGLFLLPNLVNGVETGTEHLADGTAVPHYAQDSDHMDLYEATCHAMTTLATGGFSTRQESVAEFSGYHHWVIIIGMFLAGVNFLMFWHIIRGQFRRVAANSELRMYMVVVLIVAASLVVGLMALPVQPIEGHGDDRIAAGYGEVPVPTDEAGEPILEGHPDWEQQYDTHNPGFHGHPYKYDTTEENIRHGLFQTLTIITTTGYASADFDRWPDFCRILLMFCMVLGACAGSTSGGLKMIRSLVIVKQGIVEVKRLVFPHGVMHVKVQGERVPDKVLHGINGTAILILLLFLACSLVYALLPNFDFITSISCSASMIGNIGPGLGSIGPSQDFAWINGVGKALCCAQMLLGRLEIYTVLILFVPSLYRK